MVYSQHVVAFIFLQAHHSISPGTHAATVPRYDQLLDKDCPRELDGQTADVTNDLDVIVALARKSRLPTARESM